MRWKRFLFAGNQNNQQDPWQKRPDGNHPPDLDELFRDLSGKLNRLFTSRKNGSRDGGDGGGNQGRVFHQNNLPVRFISIAGILILLVLWFIAGFYIVNEKERAIVLRLGKYHATLQPGLQWQPYFIDKVTKINITQLRDFSTQGLMLTEDENIVDVALVVQYRIDNPQYFLLNVLDPAGSVALAVDSAIRHVVGSSSMDRVITVGRAAVALEVLERAQSYQDKYQTGVRIVQVNVSEARAPSEVKPAFDDVISAREDEERFINQATTYANGVVPEARGKAQRMLEEANGYKEQVIARAEGEAERFTKLLVSYRSAPEVTRQRLYIEAMQQVLANSSKVLLDVSGDAGNIMYLPLDQIIKGNRNTGATDDADTNAYETYSADDIPSIAEKVAEYLRNGTANSRPLRR